jgi:alkylation response protein AidB-like acyl-CoA dehydrogenase
VCPIAPDWEFAYVNAEPGRFHVFYTIARIVAPVILKWGSEEQKREFLPPMVRGEISVWQAPTEPQGGSDVATCRTKAIREGDHYVVNGRRRWWAIIIRPTYSVVAMR